MSFGGAVAAISHIHLTHLGGLGLNESASRARWASQRHVGCGWGRGGQKMLNPTVSGVIVNANSIPKNYCGTVLGLPAHQNLNSEHELHAVGTYQPKLPLQS